MNKFYDVHNKGKNAKSHFIIAKDEKDAFRIASTQPGKPKSLNELPIEDNIQNLIDSGKTGILARKIVGINGNELIDIIMGKSKYPKDSKNPWFFTIEI